MKKIEHQGPLFIFAASICWSLGGVCISFIPWGAMSIIGIRAFLAALVFIIYQRGLKIEFSKGNIMAALCLSLTTILFVFANKLTSAAAAILLQFSAPIFIIIIEFLFYKKKPSLKATIAVTTTLLGMILFFFDKLEVGNSLGNILAILSGVSFAGVFICNTQKNTNSIQSSLLSFLINAIIGLPFAFFQVTPDLTAWIAISILGIVQVGISYLLFSAGIKKTTALLACLISALEPVLNPLWVTLALGIVPGIYTIIGGIIIVSTIIFYNLGKKE